MARKRFLKPEEAERMLNEAREIHNFTEDIESIAVNTIVESAKRNGRIGDKVLLVISPYQAHIPGWQRTLDLSRAREIGTHYDKNQWGTPKLIYCRGKLIVADGMHRIIGALMADLNNIVVEIIEIPENEAIELFLNQGVGRKNMSPMDFYRGSITLNKKEYIEFRDICHKYNVQIKGDDELENPVGVFTSICDGIKMDKELLDRIMSLINRMRWCSEEITTSSKSAYSSKVIRSFRALYAFYEGNEDALERIMLSSCYGSEWFIKNISDLSQYKIFDTLNDIVRSNMSNKELKVVGKRTA